MTSATDELRRMLDERGYMPGRVTCRMHSGIWGNDDFCSKAEKRED